MATFEESTKVSSSVSEPYRTERGFPNYTRRLKAQESPQDYRFADRSWISFGSWIKEGGARHRRWHGAVAAISCLHSPISTWTIEPQHRVRRSFCGNCSPRLVYPLDRLLGAIKSFSATSTFASVPPLSLSSLSLSLYLVPLPRPLHISTPICSSPRGWTVRFLSTSTHPDW